MTDKMTKDRKNIKIDSVELPLLDKDGEQFLLDKDDEELLQSFFADCRMDIPDDGFSDRVMQALPSLEMEKEAARRRHLEHLWTAACVAIGVVAAFVCQGWEQIQAFLYAMKIDFLLSGSHVLTQSIDVLGQSHNLLMVLAGALVLLMVWGYNEVADAR